MRKFDYRAPRFTVDLPIRLTFNDAIQHARCTEISSEGMRLEVGEPLMPAACGTVCIRYQEFDLELPVRVAHAGQYYDGVKFVYESEDQRDEVNRLVARLTFPQRIGPILVR